MAEPTLLIASVYAPSASNDQWLRLQHAWLARTLEGVDYRFGIVLNGVPDLELPAGIEVIERLSDNAGHAAGLASAAQWMRSGSASHCLFLDSDAFPVTHGWLPHLLGQMARFSKRVAAPVRFENLDRFPHPCAMLVERSVLDESWFSLRDGIEAPNLLGDTVRDVAASMVDRYAEVLPLLRSNVVNLHPVAAAIYHDCFYHHGAGSREFRFRVTDRYRYLESWPTPWLAPESLSARLFDDSDAFIQLLRGTSDAVRRL